ncbi:rhamnan synthesis F family protein [Lactococcus lactis]|uniref:rhamnan synthesis F family protein n=1 Tax=Lactococcus lactis TaxID=1358 RepID=UPI0017835B12|nr:alpha-L-Rha alpha-1,3-L-rhamnosyltransferase [Lactococcus lactis]
MKRILLFVHFNKYNDLSKHVLYTLEKMSPLFERTIFISNSLFPDSKRELINPYITDFIQRENKGFDFAAWRDGLEFVGYEQLKIYDSLTLMNDTCFGPLYEMLPYYKKYEEQHTDFWGMTNHRSYQESKHHYFEEHIQSYYKVFSKKVLQSETFKNFWQDIKDFTEVQEVIDHYEIQSTSAFLKAGFQYESILDTRELDNSRLLHPDFSYYAPDVILQNQVPFIKVKAFQGIENAGIVKYMVDYIEKYTDYPVELLLSHLSTVGYPDQNYMLARKYLKPVAKIKVTKKIAVHLHVFYIELLSDFLDAFNNFHFEYDLYLTTNTKDKEDQIRKILSERDTEAVLVRTPNYGRDLIPFLSLKNMLRRYDIVGHFHTKRSLEAAFFAGESWRTELMDMLIAPADNIIYSFERDSNLGIVIADIPTFFRFNRVVNPDSENQMIAPLMNDLWERMEMKKKVNFHEISTFTMSYGTFFWSKVDTLEPLFNVQIMEKEIPQEPLPQNTILHAIERILVYMAWDKDYDFRISKNKEELTPFIDNRTLNQRFYITPENVKNIRLKFVAKLLVKKMIRFVKYRTYKLLGRDLTSFM